MCRLKGSILKRLQINRGRMERVMSGRKNGLNIMVLVKLRTGLTSGAALTRAHS
ncbi:hypothetical protein HanPSC8_Chr05g0210051 [Helianthus annuus]|nr:hypothetical protein HanPSC8_Chr05g0210051 [Helianthus annuus]